MKRFTFNRRMAAMAIMTMLLAACQVVPRTPTASSGSVPAPAPSPVPAGSAFPDGNTPHHRVALLVPLSGENAGVGNSIANATTMALLDTNTDNLKITAYDTAQGARSAARKAVTDGNKLILGPLFSANVSNVLAEARPARIPVISYTNDAIVAAPDVFVMGQVPSQSIRRTVDYARRRGATNFGSIVPNGKYGRQVDAAFRTAVAEQGGRVIGTETYDRNNSSVENAANRLIQSGDIDTVLIADSARLASLAANALKPGGRGRLQLLGTELLSGEGAVRRSPAMHGLWYSAISDSRYKKFSDSYSERFGSRPYRLSTLGYDSVLLALRVARKGWNYGESFPVEQLYDDGGFLGLDGAFRFDDSGVIERAMEVREVRENQIAIISPAPSTFEN